MSQQCIEICSQICNNKYGGTNMNKDLKQVNNIKRKSGFTLAEVFSVHPKGGRKRAFTLAEVLITLGIIGVVAAMTLPTLIQKHQKIVIETQAKQIYSTLQQIIRLSEANDLIFKDIMTYKDLLEWFDDYVSKNMQIIKSCNRYVSGCWHTKGIVKDLSGNAVLDEQESGMIGNYPFAFIDKQGRYYDLDLSAALTISYYFGVDTYHQSLEIFFDVNGAKKPNVIGKDIYVAIWSDRGLLPAGYDRSREEVENNCLNGNGYFCLSYLMQNNWIISDKVWRR